MRPEAFNIGDRFFDQLQSRRTGSLVAAPFEEHGPWHPLTWKPAMVRQVGIENLVLSLVANFLEFALDLVSRGVYEKQFVS
jgi:hypothetical protein